MTSIRHVLCPVDLSGLARRALDLAVAVAGRYGADVTALHVAAPRERAHPARLAALRGELDRFVAPARVSGVCVRTAVEEGSACEVVTRRARDLPADLVVMGTHGADGSVPASLGSVAAELLRVARCPVLTVSKPPEEAFPLEEGRFGEVVCALDLKDECLETLSLAEAMAQAGGAALTLLHVLEVAPQDEADAVEAGQDLGALRARRCARARRLLRETADGIGVHGEVVRPGEPAVEILRFARECHAGLVVVGTRRNGTPNRFPVGSTADEVMRGASCPVLTVRERP